ncbi:cupin domain protein, partial [Vibrio parahaemolyticus V-223/04]
NTYLVAITPHE